MKKILAWIVTLAMLCGMMPLTAFSVLAEECLHTYENGICTACGAEHPNLANYEGKVISIMGDSISTFAGYIPTADGFNLAHKTRYPQDNLLTDVNETWWMQIISQLDAKLGINDSWASSEVYNYIDAEVNSTSDGTKACMASTTRIQNLGSNGTPDVILFFGGTNDITQSRPVGIFDPSTAPTEVDLTSVKWETVADAYVDAIMRMQYYYPEAQIFAMLPFDRNSQGTAKVNKYNSLFASICEHYGVPYVDLRECGISNADLPDGTHPDATGMDYITAAVLDVLMSDCNVTTGEHIVHSVTHNLTDAKSSLSYYKGISHGKPFVTTIAGENLKVTVTMGGTDITAECYADGVVSIEKVTGNLVVTAQGLPKTVYADYLQELPENICAESNLWTILKPINLYYRSTGWGLNATGLAHSITFAVSVGDRIWATSFQASGINGGTKNGIALTWFDEEGAIETFSPEKTYAEFIANGYLTAPEGAVAVNVVMWNGNESNEVYILNRDHTYENGVCTGCGAKIPNSISLRYDDHYDVTGKTVEIVDAGKPTSYQVGYGVAENAVRDTAVVTLSGDTLIATGIGTATVRIDGELYEITVTAAPISLILLTGQSNMRGSEGNADQSIVCPDGMVYATYGDDRGADNTAMSKTNARLFAPSALAGKYSSINVEGTTECLSGYPVYSLNEAGAGKIGPDSGFAYEWVQQTGEKVWVVNAAHGGTSINLWQDGGKEFEECERLFKACQETLRKEIAAGHFTLSHMAYFWCQGCSDAANTAEQYAKKYLSMHESLKTVLAFDHDSDSATADYTFEFGGIIPVRAGNATSVCYREGVYTDTTTAKYHESFKDLRFTGPRVAQYWMINNPELPDIWGVCNIGEDWVWMPDGTNGVADYFNAHYENGTVDYKPQVSQKASWYKPTTPAAVHDSIHYNQIGYNEIGRESVRNALIMLGEMKAPDVETTVELLSWDGYNTVDTITAAITGTSNTLVVPKVYPVWKAKEVTYDLSDGLIWNYYDLLAENVQISGTLEALGQRVTVVKTEPGAHYVDHLSELPENVCCGLNLWTLLEHDPEFYHSGTHWATHETKDVMSVTIPVMPGDKIFATAFGKAGTNGHETANGIRVTFFNEYGAAKTTDPAGTYKEFVANGGYLIVPEGATAANIPMWTNDNSNELYILNRFHDTSNGICGICGKDSHVHEWGNWEMKEIPDKGEPVTEERSCSGCGETETREVESVWQKYDLAAHYSDLPENVCSGLNLWNVLEHDKYYFANGTNWGKHSSGNVYSVTIPVETGERIFATAWGKAVENGHATANGIRVSFFSAYGVAKTLDPAACYAEFSKNGGYLMVPENAVAINIAMWNNSDENEIYLLDREHPYTSTVTAPTCTEQGYTTHTCECGESYIDDYVEATEHAYENGICTGCGTEHPNLANYEGKVISILGGSTCTFDGYIPVADGFNLTHRPRYPQSNLLTDVNDTWWMQVIAELDAKLGINDSWAGSQVLNTLDGNSGDLGPDAAMASLTRIQNLGANGTPDIILFYGAMNDIGRGVSLGSFDVGTAPSQADLTATKWSNLADAYVAAILRMQHYYPNAEIVAMLPGPTASYYTEAERKAYCEVLKAICDHYGVPTVDLSTCGLTTDDMPDGTHPNAEGMDYITAAVLDTLLNECQMEADENMVHSVTHELTGAKSSLSYYKGVSDGKSFVTTITGEDVAVTVTMGGIDITDQVYANGKISISAVTGDIVITAKGKYNADGRLQQLPENYCCDTNLWTTLDPVNEYYTASGWGNNSNSNYSVTFPVTPGDQIWATSFGAAGTNGYSANAVRITWFGKDGVLKSLGREVVYAEFSTNGYITVPAGAVAVNVPMVSNADTWEIYILNRSHVYDDDRDADCNVCGTVRDLPALLGDANGDGKVNNRDLGLLQQYLADMDVEVVLAVCDVTADGRVNNRDLGLLQQYLADMDVEFG